MDIQQGDWLYIDGEPKQFITQECDGVDNVLDDYEPIPITKEILQDSGWNYVGNVCVLRSAVRFGWKPDTKELIIGYTRVPFYVLYIHELQHFLNVFRVQTPIVVKK